MLMQEVHYEIVQEDEQGFNPMAVSCSTREEAEVELRRWRSTYPGAFIVRTTMTRVGSMQPRHLYAV